MPHTAEFAPAILCSPSRQPSFESFPRLRRISGFRIRLQGLVHQLRAAANSGNENAPATIVDAQPDCLVASVERDTPRSNRFSVYDCWQNGWRCTTSSVS